MPTTYTQGTPAEEPAKPTTEQCGTDGGQGTPKQPGGCKEDGHADRCVANLEQKKAEAEAKKARAERCKSSFEIQAKQHDEDVKKLDAIIAKLRDQVKKYQCERMKVKARCDCLTAFWKNSNEELNKRSFACRLKVSWAIRDAKNARQAAKCDYVSKVCPVEGVDLGTYEYNREKAERKRDAAKARLDELLKLDYDKRLAELEKLKADIEKAACDKDIGRWWYLLRELFGPKLALLHDAPSSGNSPYLAGVVVPTKGAAGCNCDGTETATETPEEDCCTTEKPAPGGSEQPSDETVPPEDTTGYPCGDVSWNPQLGFLPPGAELKDYGTPEWWCPCRCSGCGTTKDQKTDEKCKECARCERNPGCPVAWCDLDADEYCEAVEVAHKELNAAETALATAEATLAAKKADLARAKAVNDDQQKNYEKKLLDSLKLIPECKP